MTLRILLICKGYKCLLDVILTQESKIIQTYDCVRRRIPLWHIFGVAADLENENIGYICYCKDHQNETQLLPF